MDSDGANDQRQKELSISLAASSMINGSDMISEDAYQANLKRIQEVKEMVRRLEMNNESAHKNYVVHQLEQRAKDGHEAEVMLARLRNQPGLSETIQLTNNAPSDNSELILPTTATLTEVPESHPSSYSSPTPTATPAPRVTKRGRFVDYQWPQTPYNPNLSPYGVPVQQPPQHSVASRPHGPTDSQMNWYTTQSPSLQSSAHNPLVYQPGFPQTQTQQPPQSWRGNPPLTVVPPVAHAVPTPGWVTMAPTHSGPSTSSSGPVYRETSFQTQPTGARPPVTTHRQAQNFTVTSQGPVPPYGVSVPSAKAYPVQPLLAQSHPAESQPQPQSAPRPPSRSHQQAQPPQPQPLPQPPPQLRQQSRPTQPQPQRHFPLQPLQHSQQIQELPTYLRAPAQSTDRALSTEVSQSKPSQARESLPANASHAVLQTQPLEPTVVQEQRGAQARTDPVTFIKLFQTAVQRGIPHLKAFFVQAKASGVSGEWLRAAINSLPRDVRESVMAQANQSVPALDVPSSADIPLQQAATIPGSNMLVVGAQPLLAATPTAQTLPVPQQVTESGVPTEERPPSSAPGQLPGSYAAQLQYYAEQATKSALSAQVASISATPPESTSSIQNTIAAPTRDVSKARVTIRTPKDANKSTLARDILRSLGKIVPKSCQDKASEPTDRTDSHENNQLPEINAQSVSSMASPKHPTAGPVTSPVRAISFSVPPGKPDLQVESQGVSANKQLASKSVLKDERGCAAVVEGPIMIDLTLEDSDESVAGNGQEPEPTFPIQTFTTAATSQPVSPTNTTNHTPLLKNLSLEEPRVDVATDGDDTDVRMSSPPLSLATEENAEPGLLYPPLGSAETVPSNFEPLPREASEHHMNGQLPLFLPSPTLSPGRTEPPETDLEMTNDEGRDSPFLKRRSVDIDEMEIDAALLAPRHVKKRRKQQVYVLIPPAPPYVKRVIKRMKERAMGKDRDSGMEAAEEDEEIQYSHLEQVLIEESKSTLLERRCRWLNCGVILNCAVNLFTHMKNHAREEDSQPPFRCHWADCRRQFDTEDERDVHLEKHTIRPLSCPFAGCDEQFSKPVEVMEHEVQHQRAEHREPLMRKPAYQPVVPAIPARLGPPPQRLPSHRVMPRRVVKCRISAERHAAVGPWILWNIFSPVDLSTRKQNASMRARLTRQAINPDVDGSNPRRDDYDFLLALSPYPAKNPQLDDLDSTLITMSAARGLTLWGPGSAVNSAPGTGTPEAAELAFASGETQVGDGREVARENSGRQSRQSVVTGEEDAVERMLIAWPGL